MTDNFDSVLNNKYKIFNSKEEHSHLSNIKRKSFTINGEYYFKELNLREYGWEEVHPHTHKQKKALENNPNHGDFKKIIKYKGPKGIAYIHLNYLPDKHVINILFIDDPESKPKTIETLKFMFESESGYGLFPRERGVKETDPIHDLVQKLKRA